MTECNMSKRHLQLFRFGFHILTPSQINCLLSDSVALEDRGKFTFLVSGPTTQDVAFW